MKTFYSILFSILLLLSLGSDYLSAKANCRKVLSEIFVAEKIKILKDIPFIYFFMKDIPKRDALLFPEVKEIDDRYFITKLFQSLPNTFSGLFLKKKYDFTPFQALNDIIFDRPFRVLTNRLSSHELVPRLYYTLPVSIIGSLYMYSEHIDPKFEDELNDMVNHIGFENRVRFDFLIENDFRYEEILVKMEKGISKNPKAKDIFVIEARNKAYWQMIGLSEYYRYLLDLNFNMKGKSPYHKKKEMKKANETKFINHVLFLELKALFLSGIVLKRKGFYIPKKSVGKISEYKKELLYKNQHELLLKYEYIASLFSKEGILNKNAYDNSTFNGTFYGKLLNLNMESIDLYYDMQEYALWESRFKKWKILGVKKYKKDQANQYTEKFLTIEDIEKEFL